MDNKKLLGQRIKQIRKQSGFTQEKLSELIGIETGSLSGIESGRSFPSMTTIEKISNILGVEIKTLFEFNQLISIDEMRKNIAKNIYKINDAQIPYIYKFFDDLKWIL